MSEFIQPQGPTNTMGGPIVDQTVDVLDAPPPPEDPVMPIGANHHGGIQAIPRRGKRTLASLEAQYRGWERM